MEEEVKKKDGIYQVVDFSENGVFLQNVRSTLVFEETSLSEEFLNELDIDTVLKYENEKYVIDEVLTEKFMNSMVDIKKLVSIKKEFVEQSKIDSISPNMVYVLQKKEAEYSILVYGNLAEEKQTMKVPNALIPFFAIEGDSLYYKSGKFNIK